LLAVYCFFVSFLSRFLCHLRHSSLIKALLSAGWAAGADQGADLTTHLAADFSDRLVAWIRVIAAMELRKRRLPMIFIFNRFEFWRYEPCNCWTSSDCYICIPYCPGRKYVYHFPSSKFTSRSKEYSIDELLKTPRKYGRWL
jgi:hypothetical protein